METSNAQSEDLARDDFDFKRRTAGLRRGETKHTKIRGHQAKPQMRNDPCYEEMYESRLCMTVNADRNYVDICKDYQKNVAMCRDFWNYVCKDRKRKGITPFLPPYEEREKVYDEYKHIIVHGNSTPADQ